MLDRNLFRGGTGVVALLAIVVLSACSFMEEEVAIRKYTVSFDSNGGSSVASQTVMHGGLVSEPDEPIIGDGTFLYWYQLGTPETPWNFSENRVRADIQLVAAWNRTEYDISLPLLANGKVEASATSAPAGTQVILTPLPSANYRLKAGSLTVTPNVEVDLVGDTFSFTMPSHAVEVRAIFLVDV